MAMLLGPLWWMFPSMVQRRGHGKFFPKLTFNWTVCLF